METKQLKELKKGEIFRLVKRKTNGATTACGVSVKVYVRDHYDRSERKYYAHDYFDACDFRAFKPTQEVTTDFEF